LVWFGFCISGEDEFAAIGRREMDIQHLHGRELVQRLAGREARCFEPKPVLQGNLEAVGNESDEDMSFDAVFALVVDRAHGKITFSTV
jgi:hypothetical protein